VNAERSTLHVARATTLAALVMLGACSWFTDFKQQPKIDPWETAADTIAFRGNPQSSVPIDGSAAPGFEYDRANTIQAVTAMANIPNPVRADSASVARGHIQYQINCAVCHGPAGAGMGIVSKYGMYPPPIGTAQSAAAGYSDGYIFGIIRNGRVLMPSYNRIEESDRWDIVNYIRTLQGKGTIARDTTWNCRPGETGACVPAASTMGPTRPSPYYHAMSAAATASGQPTTELTPSAATSVPTDTTKKPEKKP
jgi:mono/diheme cytochrome c family protein